MAKIRIKGDTSGYIDLAAPAVAGTQTLTLPTSGSLLTSASDSSDFPSAILTATSVIQPNPARFSVRLSNDQTGVTDMTTLQLTFDTTVIDNLSGYNTGTGIYTVQETGTYFLSAAAALYGNEGQNRDSHIAIMRSTDGGSNWDSICNNGSRHGGIYDQTAETNTVQTIHELNSNDQIRVYVMVNTGNSSTWKVLSSFADTVAYGIGWVDNSNRYTRFFGYRIA